jgi:hypothetical protein
VLAIDFSISTKGLLLANGKGNSLEMGRLKYSMFSSDRVSNLFTEVLLIYSKESMPNATSQSIVANARLLVPFCTV